MLKNDIARYIKTAFTKAVDEFDFWWHNVKWWYKCRLGILKIHKYKLFCGNWKKCTNLTFDQEYRLCKDLNCPLAMTDGFTRAFKTAIGEGEVKCQR